jgi:hypothetical protein
MASVAGWMLIKESNFPQFFCKFSFSATILVRRPFGGLVRLLPAVCLAGRRNHLSIINNHLVGPACQ